MHELLRQDLHSSERSAGYEASRLVRELACACTHRRAKASGLGRIRIDSGCAPTAQTGILRVRSSREHEVGVIGSIIELLIRHEPDSLRQEATLLRLVPEGLDTVCVIVGKIALVSEALWSRAPGIANKAYLDERYASFVQQFAGDPEHPQSVLGRRKNLEHTEGEKQVALLFDLCKRGFRGADVYQHRLEVAEAGGLELARTFLEAGRGNLDADVSLGQWREVHGVGAAAASPFDDPSGRLGHAHHTRELLVDFQMLPPPRQPAIVIGKNAGTPPLGIRL